MEGNSSGVMPQLVFIQQIHLKKYKEIFKDNYGFCSITHKLPIYEKKTNFLASDRLKNQQNFLKKVFEKKKQFRGSMWPELFDNYLLIIQVSEYICFNSCISYSKILTTFVILTLQAAKSISTYVLLTSRVRNMTSLPLGRIWKGEGYISQSYTGEETSVLWNLSRNLKNFRYLTNIIFF